MTKSNPHLVVKSNRLINAKLNGLTLSQIKLIEVLIAQLDKSQGGFHRQRVYLRDFAESVGTKNKNEYQRARFITKSMMKHVIEIYDDKEGLTQVNLFYKIHYPKDKPYIEAIFHPDLLPFLLQLKEQFTSYDIRNTLPLSSLYAIRIYQFLKQYLPIGERRFSVDELKEILGVEQKYKQYYDFKKNVLLIAQKELNEHCDLTFQFKEIKKGRRVEFVKFIIKPKNKFVNASRLSSEEEATIVDELIAMGIAKKQATEYASRFDEQFLREAITYAKERYEKGHVKNLGAYLNTLIENEVKVEAPWSKEQEQEANDKKKQEAALKKQRLMEEKLIATLEQEYQEYIESQIKQLVDNASNRDWEDFYNYVSKNPMIKGRVIKDGKMDREDDNTIFWFRIFISDRLQHNDEKDFIKWAMSKKGYQLRKEGENYKVVARQNQLF
ncbi:replication initiation protein [Chondrinema litorale]|uniref:replication initiation protein n=1 Tax=Chondrinema litorale TaxID=2994555 RepID=UPI002542F6A4|nr:replication initiation protein [Chondrinema litorale]UZR99237.1 replication initiation protein [Chondrinema litorale]